MNPTTFAGIVKLSDRDLLARIQVLANRERAATAELIAHLAVMDERRLYLGEGCPSLFTYCMRVLHFSESAAYRRVEAARAGRRFPVILQMLAEGSINLTTIRLLAPELTPANHRRLLEAAKCKGREQVEKLVAELRPRVPVPSIVRQLPTRTASLILPAPDETIAPIPAASADASEAEVTLLVRPPARPVIVPISTKRYKITFTTTEETRGLLRRAQDLLRHQIPNGDIGDVMAKALQLLVKHLEKEKLAATDRPRGSRGLDSRSRHIPADVKREVWKRDGGRCAFVAHSGRRCDERGFLEFHHVVPYSAGGKATVDNIELRCRAHNGFEAEQHFGSGRTGAG